MGLVLVWLFSCRGIWMPGVSSGADAELTSDADCDWLAVWGYMRTERRFCRVLVLWILRRIDRAS